VQEGVQRAHALPQSGFERVPLVGGNDARDEIERNQPFDAGLFALHSERDADAMERALRLASLLCDPVGRGPVEPVGESPVMGSHFALGSAHFVVGRGEHAK